MTPARILTLVLVALCAGGQQGERAQGDQDQGQDAGWRHARLLLLRPSAVEMPETAFFCKTRATVPCHARRAAG